MKENISKEYIYKKKIAKLEIALCDKQSIIRSLEEKIRFMESSKYWKLRNLINGAKYSMRNPRNIFQKHGHRIIFALRHPVRFAHKYYRKWRYGRAGIPEEQGLLFHSKTTPLHSNEALADVAKNISLLTSSEPVVSVVIPVYAQTAFTIRCLESIERNQPKLPFEVIVVDDYSPDQSRKILRHVRGIRLIENEENMGFVRSCNVGAAAAYGKFVYLLNNDVEVTPGWLDSLVETFDKHDDVGLVGSKLVYPDGRLQEAGGIVWSDGSAWNYGRGDHPALPRYNYVRETDYISGASIMIRKDLWDRVGGFDVRYVPAYYEDADFCFEVRKCGYRVLYQPESVIVHYEGVSNGTDLGCGIKSYQVANIKKFFEKWKDVLKREHYPNAVNVFRARERSRSRPVILVVDHYVPEPDQDAGSRTMFQYLELFTNFGYSVKFIGDNFHYSRRYTKMLEQLGVEVLYGAFWEKGWRTWLDEYGSEINFVLLSRPHIAKKYIDVIRTKTSAKILYYGHDLHHVRMQREYELTHKRKLLDEAKRWKTEERSIIERADIALYPSITEVEYIQKWLPNVRSEIMQPYMYNLKGLDYKPMERKGLLFVGGFAHKPNEDGILWFCREVFPHVLKKNDNITLTIVGSHPTKAIRNLASKHINVLGFVSDDKLNALYKSTRMVVAPLRYGAGIKGKIIEALYHGLPVVTTPCGSEGLAQPEKFCIGMTDKPLDMARAIIEVYDKKSTLQKLSEQGYEFIRENYSKESAKKRFQSIINSL